MSPAELEALIDFRRWIADLVATGSISFKNDDDWPKFTSYVAQLQQYLAPWDNVILRSLEQAGLIEESEDES